MSIRINFWNLANMFFELVLYLFDNSGEHFLQSWINSLTDPALKARVLLLIKFLCGGIAYRPLS